MLSFFFSMKGRVGVLQYWLGNMVSLPFVLYLYNSEELFTKILLELFEHKRVIFLPYIVFSIVGLFLFGWISACLMVKRYHDLGKDGSWYFSNYTRFFGPLLQFLECGFMPGMPGKNQYGPPPRSLWGTTKTVETEISALRSAAHKHWEEKPEKERKSEMQEAIPSRKAVFGKANRSSSFGRRNV